MPRLNLWISKYVPAPRHYRQRCTERLVRLRTSNLGLLKRHVELILKLFRQIGAELAP